MSHVKKKPIAWAVALGLLGKKELNDQPCDCGDAGQNRTSPTPPEQPGMEKNIVQSYYKRLPTWRTSPILSTSPRILRATEIGILSTNSWGRCFNFFMKMAMTIYHRLEKKAKKMKKTIFRPQSANIRNEPRGHRFARHFFYFQTSLALSRNFLKFPIYLCPTHA